MDDQKKKKRWLVNKNFITQPKSHPSPVLNLHWGPGQGSLSTGLFLVVGTEEYWHWIPSMLYQGKATDFPLKSNSVDGFPLIYDGINMHLKIKIL